MWWALCCQKWTSITSLPPPLLSPGLLLFFNMSLNSEKGLEMKDRRVKCKKKWKEKTTQAPPPFLSPSPLPPQPSPLGNVLGPSSYFVCTMHSCRLFIYVNLPFDQSPVTTGYPLAAPVSEGTHLWCRTCVFVYVCVFVCVSAGVWGLRSRGSLPSINMAKWFPHVVKYLCKVIWLVVEPRTSGCDLNHRWFYLHATRYTHTDTHTAVRYVLCLSGEPCACSLYFGHYCCWLKRKVQFDARTHAESRGHACLLSRLGEQNHLKTKEKQKKHAKSKTKRSIFF